MAKNEKVKNLNLTELKKQVKKLDSQREATIFIGQEGEPYKFKIDENFRKTKQHKFLDDMVDFFNHSNKNMELLEIATPYTTLLLIKHFTSINVTDDIDEALEVLDALIDLEILDKILNEMPEEEITKVYELLNKTLVNMKNNLKEGEEEAEMLSETIQNQVVKDVMLDGKAD